MAQAADEALGAAASDDERAVPLLLRGAALGRLGFYADSMTSLQAAIELEGKLLHDTYVPPFALYELGALHCAQGQVEAAEAAVRDHLSRSIALTGAMKAKNPDYFSPQKQNQRGGFIP